MELQFWQKDTHSLGGLDVVGLTMDHWNGWLTKSLDAQLGSAAHDLLVFSRIEVILSIIRIGMFL